MSDEELRQHLQEIQEVMSRAEEHKKSANAFLSDLRFPPTLCRDHPIPSLDTTESPLAETKRFCVTCGKALSDRPAIFVNGACYCFCHAKEEYRNAVAARQARQADLNLEHDKQMARFKERQATHDRALNEWVARRDAAAKGKCLGIQEKLAIVVFTAMGLCGIHPAFGVLSVPIVWFVLICIDSNRSEKATTEFQGLSQRPVFNEAPPRRVTVPEVALQQHPGNNSPKLKGVGYDRLTILKRDRFVCQNCGITFPEYRLEVHHVEPVSKGGSDSECNLITLCIDCHLEEDWFGHYHKMKNA